MAERQLLGGRWRRHGAVIPPDRRELEAQGWRTTMDYRENHVRAWDGRLRQLHVRWFAEAERDGEEDPTVVAASASTEARAWARLRAEADTVDVRVRRQRSGERADVGLRADV